MQELEEQLVLNELYVEKELQRVEQEEVEETKRLNETFNKWEKQFTLVALHKKKLPKNWVRGAERELPSLIARHVLRYCKLHTVVLIVVAYC